MTYSNSDVRVRRPISKPLSAVKTTETRPIERRRSPARPYVRSVVLAASLAFTALLAPLHAGESSGPALQTSVANASPTPSGITPLTAAFVGLGSGVALCSLLFSLRRDSIS
jgi:hypothetical protein